MQLFSLLTFATAVAAAALPDAELASVLDPRNSCPYASNSELAIAKAAFIYYELAPKKPSQFDPNPPKANLIPKFDPTATVSIDYDGKKVKYGNTFSILETMKSPNGPKLSFTAEKNYDPSKNKYHVFMLDPDVPNSDMSLPNAYFHWSFYDAQPSCITNQVRKQYTFPLNYQDPSPASTTNHRYTFLVYRQPKNYTPNPPKGVNGPGFNVTKFAIENRLVGPVAGNFFLESLVSK